MCKFMIATCREKCPVYRNLLLSRKMFPIIKIIQLIIYYDDYMSFEWEHIKITNISNSIANSNKPNPFTIIEFAVSL